MNLLHKLLLSLAVLLLTYTLGVFKGAASVQEKWDAANLEASQSETARLADVAEEMVKTYQLTNELIGELNDDPTSVPLSTGRTLDGMRQRQEQYGPFYTYPPSKDSPKPNPKAK